MAVSEWAVEMGMKGRNVVKRREWAETQEERRRER
jgi:hypothetical protein